ncbi:hypothetical protein Ocin01_03895 [Orchesella cincta]|uniref:Uncharacterized protein n=1 Tax=Orchesella cincta TaxID=48709 RepID=A0A1D2NC26_ORCCI|nr:hypothetical protein Ocin01_03895 [Orchesella cincta]
MSDEVSLELENRDDQRLKGGIFARIFQTFGFNGHVNYAFIYGTWEIIRAQTSLDKYFCLLEVWNMILHIAYAFIFLQNVLSNNLHRDPVKGRQKIPEKLIVTDYEHVEDYENTRNTCFALFALLDVLLTPIPMRVAHVIYPLSYSLVYTVFLYMMFKLKGFVLYKQLDWDKNPKQALNAVGYGVLIVTLMHIYIVGLSNFRDYFVSILDDSKTPKQLQNLRSQKRLARRKLMNFVEGPDGRVIEITLEKHAQTPTSDVFIKTVKELKQVKGPEPESPSSEEDEKQDNGPETEHVGEPENDFIPISTPVKPPPQPRYATPDKPGMVYSSSSSSNEEEDDFLEAIKDVTLPQPPTMGKSKHKRPSRIPVPIHKLGLHLKPRDSKEAIQHKLSIDRNRPESPPTPPFIRLVQTLIQQHKEKKQGLESNLKKADQDPNREAFGKGVAHVTIVGAKEEAETKRAKGSGSKSGSWVGVEYSSEDVNEPSHDAPKQTKDKPIAAAVINTPAHVKEWKEKNKDIFDDFNSKLIHKLQKEHDKRLGVGDMPDQIRKSKFASDQNRTEGPDPVKKIKRKGKQMRKGILKPAEGEKQKNHDKKRHAKLIKRRSERMFLIRQGQSVYHPLETPNIKQVTSFHYLGTKLKGEKANKKVLNPQELQAYKEHPGIATTDDVQVSGARSLVSFHPVVRYFEVNEGKGESRRKK